MADETRKTDYVPLIYGPALWEGRHSRAGAWALVLDHDLVVATSSEDTQGHILPRGSTIYLVPGSFQTLVPVGKVCTCYPGDWDRDGHPVGDLSRLVVADAYYASADEAVSEEIPF